MMEKQKRKLKLNILDVVIVVAILCSIAVLVFNDTINEVFGKPEILPLEVVSFSEIGEDGKNIFVAGTPSTIEYESVKLQSVVVSSEFLENGDSRITFSLNGYKKLGRYYSENGSLILPGTVCVVKADDKEFSVTLGEVEFSQ